MKTICLSLLSIGLLSSSLLAAEPIEAQLIASTVIAPLEKGINRWELNLHENEGTTLTYLIQTPQVISVDKESFKLTGWEISDRHRFRSESKFTTFKIYNKFYQGDISALELDGSIVINVGAKPISKTFTLKKGDDPLKFPDFTVESSEKRNGVRLQGEISMLKSIKVENDGKELRSNGSSSSNNDDFTHYYADLNEKSKITITYYSKIEKKTVKITK